MWDIFALVTAPSQDGLTNVVKKVKWRYTVTEGIHFGVVNGETQLSDPDPDSYIDYGSLTDEDIIPWLRAAEDEEAIKAKALLLLNAHKAPSEVERPWVKNNPYTGREQYVFVFSGDTSNFYGPVSWNRVSFLEECSKRGVEVDLRAKDIELYLAKILPIDSPLTMSDSVVMYRFEKHVDVKPNHWGMYTQLGSIALDTTSGRAVITRTSEAMPLTEAKALATERINMYSGGTAEMASWRAQQLDAVNRSKSVEELQNVSLVYEAP